MQFDLLEDLKPAQRTGRVANYSFNQKISLTLVMFVLWNVVTAFSTVYVFRSTQQSEALSFFSVLPGLCAPIPSLWLKDYTMKARGIGLAVGEGVALVFVFSIWFYLLHGEETWLAQWLRSLNSPSIFFALLFLPPTFAVAAAIFAMMVVKAGEVRSEL